MDQIDFLPPEYRREHTRRRRQVWQIAAVALVTGIIAAANLFQSQTATRLQAGVDNLIPQYHQAQERNNRLAELKTKLEDTQDQAELFTYLRHPWPRTQILAALLRPLPQGVTLEKIKIFRKLPSGARRQIARSQAQREAEEKRLESLSPAARDLQQIRSDVDRMQTEVTITGTTTQPTALHAYVGDLGHESFFSTAELESIEFDKREKNGRMTFELHVLVQPGYGQPGGPQGWPIAQQTDAKKTKDKRSNETKS